MDVPAGAQASGKKNKREYHGPGSGQGRGKLKRPAAALKALFLISQGN